MPSSPYVPDPGPELGELLTERYGPQKGLIREAVAKPRPLAAIEAARHRRQLLESMQMGGGTYGRRRRDPDGGLRPYARPPTERREASL